MAITGYGRYQEVSGATSCSYEKLVPSRQEIFAWERTRTTNALEFATTPGIKMVLTLCSTLQMMASTPALPGTPSLIFLCGREAALQTCMVIVSLLDLRRHSWMVIGHCKTKVSTYHCKVEREVIDLLIIRSYTRERGVLRAPTLRQDAKLTSAMLDDTNWASLR